MIMSTLKMLKIGALVTALLASGSAALAGYHSAPESSDANDKKPSMQQQQAPQQSQPQAQQSQMPSQARSTTDH